MQNPYQSANLFTIWIEMGGKLQCQAYVAEEIWTQAVLLRFLSVGPNPPRLRPSVGARIDCRHLAAPPRPPRI